MKHFLGVHKIPPEAKNDKDIDQKSQHNFDKYKAAAEKMGMKATHAYYSVAKGFAYCITEANSKDDIKKAHNDANVPVDDVIEIKNLS